MIELLAPTLVANFLLPYVKDGLKVIAEKVTESVGEAAGKEAATTTQRVWAWIQELFGADAADQRVLRDFEDDPESTAQYFSKRLADLLESNPEAAHELQALVGRPAPGASQTVSTVMGNSGVTVSVQGSTLTNSTVTGVQMTGGDKTASEQANS